MMLAMALSCLIRRSVQMKDRDCTCGGSTRAWCHSVAACRAAASKPTSGITRTASPNESQNDFSRVESRKLKPHTSVELSAAMIRCMARKNPNDLSVRPCGNSITRAHGARRRNVSTDESLVDGNAPLVAGLLVAPARGVPGDTVPGMPSTRARAGVTDTGSASGLQGACRARWCSWEGNKSFMRPAVSADQSPSNSTCTMATRWCNLKARTTIENPQRCVPQDRSWWRCRPSQSRTRRRQPQDVPHGAGGGGDGDGDGDGGRAGR